MPVRDSLRRHGWLIAIAAVYLYVFPYFPKIHSANELPRAYLVKAIVDDHTFAIDRGVARWGATADVSPSGGHQYSNKSPGSSLLAAPVYAAVDAIGGEPSLPVTLWICRVVAGIAPTLAFLWLLWGFLARWAPDPDVRRLVLVAYALGSMAMTYSILFYSHQLGAVCIGCAWILATDVADGRRGARAMAAAGFFAGAAPLADYQAVFAAVPVAVYVIARLWRRPDVWRLVVAAVLGAAVPIAVLLAYHTICFGSPWRTGYDASTTFAMYHQQGFLGITKLRWEAFVGSTVAPDNGLVALSPWWLLALPGWWLLGRPRATEAVAAEDGARRDLGTALVSASVALVYLLFVSSINFWRGGWEVGPRYITAMLPFLLPPVAALLQTYRDRPLLVGALAGSMLAGICVYVLSSATFPYWPDSMRDPLYGVTFRMLGDNLVAGNLGRALGVGGVLGLAPYLLAAFGLAAWSIARVGRWRGLAAAALVAAALVGALGLAQRGQRGSAQEEHGYHVVRDAAIDL